MAGTAEAGVDYTAATGTLTFLAGSRREVIEVATIGRTTLAEADETFTVVLTCSEWRDAARPHRYGHDP